MTIFEQMDQMSNHFTKTDLAIYENIKKFPDSYADHTLPELVSLTGFSQAALTRFAKKLGFAGFTQFQYQYINDFNSPTSAEKELTNAQFYGSFLEQTENAISKEQIQILAKRILECNHLFLAGSSLSSLPAQYLDYSAKILHYCFSVLINPIDGHQPMTHQDIYLLYSAYSGADQKRIIEGLERSTDKPYRVLVTMTPKHPLRKHFDEVFVLPEAKSVDAGRTIMTETFAFMIFNDALVNEIHRMQKSK